MSHCINRITRPDRLEPVKRYTNGGNTQSMHFILFYDYVPEYMDRRGEFRDDHLDYLKPYLERGELFLAGAFAAPADGAALVFRADTREVAEAFARSDPYVLNGLVTSWRVREWTTVVGRDAEQPIPT